MSIVEERLRGGLVVSCQAYPEEPMLDPRTMTQVAQAAVAGGAVGIRAKGLDDLRAMRVAQAAGADLVGTTLAGHTGERPKTSGPDWELIDELVAQCTVPVIAEGRIHSPADSAEAIRRGAWTVVVGTAITHPTTITRWFADAVAAQPDRS